MEAERINFGIGPLFGGKDKMDADTDIDLAERAVRKKIMSAGQTLCWTEVSAERGDGPDAALQAAALQAAAPHGKDQHPRDQGTGCF